MLIMYAVVRSSIRMALQMKYCNECIPPGTKVFAKWLSVLCMRSKAWFVAPVLLAHAEVTKNIYLMGPKLRYPKVPFPVSMC